MSQTVIRRRYTVYLIDFKYSRNQRQMSLLSKAFVLMGREKEQEEGGW